MPRYTVAHSPDADDIFMYYALAFGWVDTGDIRFDNTALDIQTLNDEALRGTYDITAISFALYPHIRNDYALLRTATSFGQGYGPKLVKRRGEPLKRRFRVALSGKDTTNALLFRIAYPDARIIYKNFLEIEGAVLSGEVDAGVLIHESILTFPDTLEVEREMWDVWCELAGGEIPLPLGGMALRRSLPITRAIQCERVLTDAVRIATRNAPALCRMLEERKLVRVHDTTLANYLSLYANDASVTLDEEHLAAIDTLYALGARHGFYDTAIRTRQYLVPTEYTDFRHC